MNLSFTIVRSNGDAGKTYSVEGDVIVFGRAEQCHVLLDDDYVSSSHAQIKCIGQDFYLQDLNSTNGTLVNSKPIIGLQQIQENTVIEFGVDGPKVRVFSLSSGISSAAIKQANVLAEIPPARSDVAMASSPMDIADAASVRLTLHKAAYFGAGCVVLLMCLFASRYLLSSPSSSATPYSSNVSEQSEAAKTPKSDAPAVKTTVTTGGTSVSDLRKPGDPTDAKADATKEVDFQSIAESMQEIAVWIALRVRVDDQDLSYLFSSGWILSESRVVTTGTAVAELQGLGTDVSVVVYSQRLPDSNPWIKVKSFHLHPEFSTSDANSSRSKENNIGILELAQALPAMKSSNTVGENDAWKATFSGNQHVQCLRCGYVIAQTSEPVSPINKPEYYWSLVSPTETLPSSSSLQILPLIRFSMTRDQPMSRGQVVVNAHNRILGTLLEIDKTSAILIPVDRISHISF